MIVGHGLSAAPLDFDPIRVLAKSLHPNNQGNFVLPPGMPIVECTTTKLSRLFGCRFSAIGMGELGSRGELIALKWNYGICV